VRLLSWPSAADQDDEEDLCDFCEALPTEPHRPYCQLYQPTFDELAWCDECQTEFATRCPCDGHDCED
jgi:hypothetical protein